MFCKLRLIGIILLSQVGFFATALSLKYAIHLLEIVTQHEMFSDNDPILSSAEFGMSITVALGCCGCWIPLQYLGRRSTLELLAVPLHILGSCLTFTFHHVIHGQHQLPPDFISTVFFLGICFQGLASGLIFVASPIYIAETVGVVTSKSFLIGLLLLASQLATTTGLLIANIFTVKKQTYFFHLIPPACQIMCLIGFNFLPESPRWLLFRKFRVMEAKIALEAIMKGNEKNNNINKQLQAYHKEYENYKGDRSFTTYIHLLLVVIGLCSLWHLNGVHIYDFYASWTLKFAGISPEVTLDPILLSLCVRFSSLSILIALYLIVNDASFHTMFLMFASCVITLSLTMTGICFYSFEEDITWISSFYWLPLATFFVFQCAFWLGSGSQACMISVVILPSYIRPSIFSIGGTIFWLTEIFSTKLILPMITSLHPFGTFWFFAGMSAISLMFWIFSVFPEIKEREKTIEIMSTEDPRAEEVNPLYTSRYNNCEHI